MSRTAENTRYEAKRKAAGFVRGPRISSDAAERLHQLAYEHRIPPCEVVSRLLLEMPLSSRDNACESFRRRERLSDAEMQYLGLGPGPEDSRGTRGEA